MLMTIAVMDTSLHPITLGEYRTTADFQDQTGEEGENSLIL